MTTFLFARAAAVAALVAVGAVGYCAGRHGLWAPFSAADGPVSSAVPAASGPVRAGGDVSFGDAAQPRQAAGITAKRVRYYRHPMGLPDTSPAPKKDSMGMDYIAVYDGEDADGDTVKIGPGKLQRAGVRTEAVERRVLAVPINVPGIVQTDERRVAVVSLRAQGFVEKVEAVTTGEHVHKGEPLMRLYSPEIAAAAAQYLSAISDSTASGAQGLEGAKRRLQNLEIPQEVIAEIERTRKVPMAITWRAPRDGVVIERNISDGMRAMPGDVLFRIEDHSFVWVLADVAERDLALLTEGQRVTVKARGYPDRPFTGKVALVYPHLMKETRTARVRIELPNPDELLRPEMYADVEIATGTEAKVVAVPQSAVIDSGSRQIVILDKGDGRFEPREVKLGRRGDGYVEIREGVEEGQTIVVSANFLIDAESNLKAALRGLAQVGETR